MSLILEYEELIWPVVFLNPYLNYSNKMNLFAVVLESTTAR